MVDRDICLVNIFDLLIDDENTQFDQVIFAKNVAKTGPKLRSHIELGSDLSFSCGTHVTLIIFFVHLNFGILA